MIDVVPVPNLSIILPGNCDVKCKFCTWRAGATMGASVHDKYLSRIKHILDTLPPYFISISLTGGEPLLSPYLWGVLDIIDKKRWQRVGITTNATHLTNEILDKFQDKLDFINISRHHYDDEINATVFDGDNIPTTEQLTRINQYAYSIGIPVSYNTVLTKYLSVEKSEIEKFVKFAYKTHARGINFRKIQGKITNTDPSSHEALYLNDPTYVNYPCPVCRTASTFIHNMRISWKAAVLEPSLNLGYWFEGVLHPNGVLSGDWDGIMVGEPDELQIKENWQEDFETFQNNDIFIDDEEVMNMISDILETKYGL